jgi:catechol 2,3-dioxygenase-like lactoylglutathione lyase family enzyme
MPVLGIGGLFFRAEDPDGLSRWYREHLGVGPSKEGEWAWEAQGGPVVFQPFRATTDYFAPGKQYMLNLRVSDMDGLLAKLAAEGIAVVTKPEWNSPDTGHFARVRDPEGNEVELWEPPA